MTPAMLETLCAILDHVMTHGVAPTVRELGDVLGIQVGSAHRRVKSLVDRGYVRRERRATRGIRVLRLPPMPAGTVEYWRLTDDGVFEKVEPGHSRKSGRAGQGGVT